MKKINKFFDKLEDKIRFSLSKKPRFYALVAGVGIVLFWRGVWHLADDLEMSSGFSLFLSLVIMLLSGTFVSFFIGEQILISGLRQEKRLDEKTIEELKLEKQKNEEIFTKINELYKELKELKENLKK